MTRALKSLKFTRAHNCVRQEATDSYNTSVYFKFGFAIFLPLASLTFHAGYSISVLFVAVYIKLA